MFNSGYHGDNRGRRYGDDRYSSFSDKDHDRKWDVDSHSYSHRDYNEQEYGKKYYRSSRSRSRSPRKYSSRNRDQRIRDVGDHRHNDKQARGIRSRSHSSTPRSSRSRSKSPLSRVDQGKGEESLRITVGNDRYTQLEGAGENKDSSDRRGYHVEQLRNPDLQSAYEYSKREDDLYDNRDAHDYYSADQQSSSHYGIQGRSSVVEIDDEDKFLYGEDDGRRSLRESMSERKGKNSTGRGEPHALSRLSAYDESDETSIVNPFGDQDYRKGIPSQRTYRDSEYGSYRDRPESQSNNHQECGFRINEKDTEDQKDVDPTIQNILKSIGFNFELSKLMQEKAEKERERLNQGIDLHDNHVNFDKGEQIVDLTSSYEDSRFKSGHHATIEVANDSKRYSKRPVLSSTESYEERAKRYREEQAKAFRDETETKSSHNEDPPWEQDAQPPWEGTDQPPWESNEVPPWQQTSQVLGGSHSSQDTDMRSSSKYKSKNEAQRTFDYGHGKTQYEETRHSTSDIRDDNRTRYSIDRQSPNHGSKTYYDEKYKDRSYDQHIEKSDHRKERQNDKRKRSRSYSRSRSRSPRDDDNYITKKIKSSETQKQLAKDDLRNVLSSDKKILDSRREPPKRSVSIHSGIDKEALEREKELRLKHVTVLENELQKLRRQQGEIMRKKQRQKDGHKDPLLVENSKLQSEICKQITALKKAIPSDVEQQKSKPVKFKMEKKMKTEIKMRPVLNDYSSEDDEKSPEKVTLKDEKKIKKDLKKSVWEERGHNKQPYKQDSVKYNKDDDSKYKDDSSKYKDDNSKYKDDNSKYKNDSSKYKIDSSKYKDSGSKFKDDSSKYKEESSKFKDDNFKYKDSSSKYKRDHYKSEKPKPKFVLNYDFFDPGNHWCRKCNVVLSTVFELFQHMQKKSHTNSLDSFDRPWKKDSHHSSKQNQKSKFKGQTVSVPVKGIEFFTSAQAFYCKLCSEFSGDAACAEEHLRSEDHYKRYMDYVNDNPFYEKRLNLDKAAGVSKVNDVKEKESKTTASANVHQTSASLKRDDPSKQVRLQKAEIERLLKEQEEVDKQKDRQQVESEKNVRDQNMKGNSEVSVGKIGKPNWLKQQQRIQEKLKQQETDKGTQQKVQFSFGKATPAFGTQNRNEGPRIDAAFFTKLKEEKEKLNMDSSKTQPPQTVLPATDKTKTNQQPMTAIHTERQPKDALNDIPLPVPKINPTPDVQQPEIKEKLEDMKVLGIEPDSTSMTDLVPIKPTSLKTKEPDEGGISEVNT